MTLTRSTRWWPAALTLAERAAAARTETITDRSLPTTPRTDASASRRVQRWRAQRPFDRPELLARRLQLDELTEEQFEMLLTSSPDTITHSEPQWVSHVDRAEAIAHELARRPRTNAETDPNGLGPVRAFVEPFVTAAMSRLYDAARGIAELHPDAPFDPLVATRLFEPSLWGQLVGRAMKVVILELNVARVRSTLAGSTPQERCADFTDQLREGPVRDQIIEEYPVLARSLVTSAEHWTEMASEFLAHLAVDAALLREAFADGESLGVLTALTAAAGDLHRNGRSVIVAEFSLGTRVVFKPRPLTVDRHFHELIEWTNAHGQQPQLRAVRTITVGSHGWAEFVANTPCETRDDVARFYARFGAYLAILHVLNATDFHYENVIASGELPMLIDLEALFHPLPDSFENNDGDPEWLGWAALQRSVLRTGVLPFRAYDTEQSSGLDMSAVGGSGGQQTPNRFPVIVAPGTDEMRLERDFVRLPESQNRPALGNDPVDPAAFADRVLSGFARTYRLLLRHRTELLAPDGPIHRFANDDIRIVLRPTRQYALILSESHHPDVLRDALERDRLIDRLWVAVPGRPELEQIIHWEHADLLNGDVPLFTSRPASRDLFTTHDSTITEFFGRPGLALAIERIQSLSEDDLRRQQWIVEASLVALLPGRHDNAPPVAPESAPRSSHRVTPPSRDEIIDAARGVTDRLTTVALQRDDRVSWLGLTLVRERDWVIQPVGTDLYSGTAGIALFLSYFDHVAGHDEARRLAQSVVKQVVQRTTATVEALTSEASLPAGALGAFGALGGAVYALSHIGALWNDHELLDVAEHVVSALSSRVESDRHLDIIGGTAGFAMAAAALERVRPAMSTRSALRRAADHLLTHAAPVASGIAWTTTMPATEPLTGMSHGASGIALALATVGQRLGDDALVDLSMKALRYERSTFMSDRRNWPDYRILDGRVSSDGPPTMWAWCHGAPGIGLARLAALGVAPSPEAADDLTTALESTACFGFGSNDSLCHGDLGNLDLLIGARELGYSGYWEHTLAAESTRLVSRLRQGHWRCGIPGGVETPGLMTGLAGIGFGLLRLGAPDRVPSLLALEGPRVGVGLR